MANIEYFVKRTCLFFFFAIADGDEEESRQEELSENISLTLYYIIRNSFSSSIQRLVLDSSNGLSRFVDSTVFAPAYNPFL